MSWVVDTCLLIDIAEEDANFCDASTVLLDAKRSDGLLLCPVCYIELAPVFEGDKSGLLDFLEKVGVRWPVEWTVADTDAAYSAWHDYVKQKRQRTLLKHPIADILIGAFALRFQGLLTRNGIEFRKLIPSLAVIEP